MIKNLQKSEVVETLLIKNKDNTDKSPNKDVSKGFTKQRKVIQLQEVPEMKEVNLIFQKYLKQRSPIQLLRLLFSLKIHIKYVIDCD